MKKYITIISGGSGNTAILTALYRLGYSSTDIRIIINAYDSGKSTGICRHITNTLGVSDIRKNHWKIYKLEQNRKNKEIDANLEKFYSSRLNLISPREDAIQFLIDCKLDNLVCYVDNFFDQTLADTYNYYDFSIANIVYSSMFMTEGYEYTLKYFSNLLDIDNCVIINSYDNVWLNAKTANKNILADEGDIVEFCSHSDKITDVFFTSDSYIKETLSCDCVETLENSKLIIISTGTFWSSIYPTFKYGEFRKYYEKSNAKKYWFLNSSFDNDSYDVGSLEFIKYLNDNNTIPVLNYDANEKSLKCLDNKSLIASFGNISGKHDPIKLASFLENIMDL